MCRGQMHSGRWRSPSLRRTLVRPSLVYKQNLQSSLKITEHHSTPQSTLLRHQSNRTWRRRGVSGSLVKDIRESLVTQQVQHVPGFLPWTLLGRPPLLTQCVDLDVHLYYTAVQSLTYDCENVPQTTAESSDTLPLHCAQHVQQSVDMSIQLPSGLKCDPLQMAEVVQQECVLLGGGWLYPRVNVENTVHLSKHHSYCLQSQNRRRKNRPHDRR